MSFTQERLRDLLLEYKRYIDAFNALVTGAKAREDAGLDARAKYVNIIAELEGIRAIEHPRFTIEWEKINRNWKRNQRQADIQRAKRRRLGVVPRRDFEGIQDNYVPRGILALSPDQMREEEEYMRAQEEAREYDRAQGVRAGTATARQAKPLDDVNLDAIRCQYELGLANPPSAAQLAAWKAERGELG